MKAEAFTLKVEASGVAIAVNGHQHRQVEAVQQEGGRSSRSVPPFRCCRSTARPSTRRVSRSRRPATSCSCEPTCPFRTVKPFQLGSPLPRGGAPAGACYGCFSLLDDEPARRASRAWSRNPRCGKRLAQHAPEFVEAGVIKSQPEFLVFGHAHCLRRFCPRARRRSVRRHRKVVSRRRAAAVSPRGAAGTLREDPPRLAPRVWRPRLRANPPGMGRARDEAGRIMLPYFEADGMPWRPDAVRRRRWALDRSTSRTPSGRSWWGPTTRSG